MIKIIGNTKQVEETISEINFYDYDPVSLPSLSRNQSDNGIYYFFAPKQYTNANKSSRKRSSKYGKWKLSGGATEINGKSGETIGDKKVLVYEKNGDPKAKGIKSPWVMHEYQITHSQYHNLDTCVICKLFDKREESKFTYGNNSSEPTHHPQVSAITTCPEVKEPGQEIGDLYRNDSNIRTSNYQKDLPVCDCSDPNTWLYNYENIASDELLNQRQVEHLIPDQDFTTQENYRQMNPARELSTVLHEFEELNHEINYGMSVNDFIMMSKNVQEDCRFDPNMLDTQNKAMLNQYLQRVTKEHGVQLIVLVARIFTSQSQVANLYTLLTISSIRRRRNLDYQGNNRLI